MVALNSVEMDEAILGDAALRSKVEHANEILADILGSATPRANVRWRLSRDSTGRKLLGVNLSEDVETAGAALVEGDFADEDRLWIRLHRLWGEVLRNRSHRQLEELHRIVGQLQDD